VGPFDDHRQRGSKTFTSLTLTNSHCHPEGEADDVGEPMFAPRSGLMLTTRDQLLTGLGA
jgi:hypothetical protein